jgi:diadenosine tetraphosphate (Ap4A) HIT family hydrolase
MRVVHKPEALELLAANRNWLLPDGQGCVMCALLDCERGSPTIASSEHAAVVLDRFGSRRGHLLVILRRHVEHVTDIEWPVYSALQRLAYDAAHAVTQVFAPKRVFVAALGASSALPMSYPHLHLHVIPVYEDDERARPANVLSWSQGVVVYDDDEARALDTELRRAWPLSARDHRDFPDAAGKSSERRARGQTLE